MLMSLTSIENSILSIVWFLLVCGPGKVRSCNFELRRFVLYPVELQGQFYCFLSSLSILGLILCKQKSFTFSKFFSSFIVSCQKKKSNPNSSKNNLTVYTSFALMASLPFFQGTLNDTISLFIHSMFHALTPFVVSV